jgi:hypothetical protein
MLMSPGATCTEREGKALRSGRSPASLDLSFRESRTRARFSRGRAALVTPMRRRAFAIANLIFTAACSSSAIAATTR